MHISPTIPYLTQPYSPQYSQNTHNTGKAGDAESCYYFSCIIAIIFECVLLLCSYSKSLAITM